MLRRIPDNCSLRELLIDRDSVINMKRPGQDTAPLPQSRPKFSEAPFQSGIDRFHYFFAGEIQKLSTSTISVPPFAEVSVTSSSPLYHCSLHPKLSSLQPPSSISTSPLLSLLSNYLDLLLLNTNPDILPLPDIYTHILNHVYKYKSLIRENSTPSAQNRDQAFNPAIVLVIVPTQAHAKIFIEFLVKTHCKNSWKKVSKFSRKKYDEIFIEENDNSDAVKLGITIGEKDLNLFSAFKRSDIILATPLSLKQGLEKNEGYDTGILCSIQLCAMIDVHMILMQNWDHLEDIFKNMNLIPDRDSVSNDINRIRNEYLEGNSKNFRQLILHTETLTPLIMSLFNRNPNQRGKAKTIEHYHSMSFRAVQRFRKFNAASVAEMNDKRFEFFVSHWEKVKEELLPKAVIFVGCYFEYIKIKNYLEENDPGVGCICEYTSKSDRQRAMSLWNSGSSKAICTTERLLHFRPLKLKNIGNLVFYSIPDFRDKYSALVSECQESTVIFCRFDGFGLQRILGDSKAEKILSSSSDIFSIT